MGAALAGPTFGAFWLFALLTLAGHGLDCCSGPLGHILRPKGSMVQSHRAPRAVLGGRGACGLLESAHYLVPFGIERVKGPRHPPALV